MKYSEITLYEFILHSLSKIPIFSSGKYHPLDRLDSIYDIEFRDDYFGEGYTSILEELFE